MTLRNTCWLGLTLWLGTSVALADHQHAHHHPVAVQFDVRSITDGDWSDARVWKPRPPRSGDRVLVSPGTHVRYDSKADDVYRLVQVVGTLRFATDRDTVLNVGLLKVQNSDTCSESGFACDFHAVNDAGEPHAAPAGPLPQLLVGTPEEPVPAEFTARIRLHYVKGMDPNDAPALACCSARMELHGAPLSRTWVKLGADAHPKDTTVTLAEPVTGWKVGDEVLVTASENNGDHSRNADPEDVGSEQRRITKIDGRTLHLDKPLGHEHYGEGEFRSEVANLSRNVIVESADPDGVRGHTVYHRFSQGGISYARFAHLGKEGVLGRYAIHFHLVGDSMRGSQVLGAAIVDSHNRWITVHGTEYLVVRDCIGYKSVGHGYFLEDGTEVYALLDRNLGVRAFRGKRLPDQVLPFDPNDGAAFWWGNGRNTLVRNVACQNEEYGFRYDMQSSRSFDCTLPVTGPDGTTQHVDVRTIPIWRFAENESHTEGLYGLVVAANGTRQPDHAIRSPKQLEHLREIDWTGPDTRHPHVIQDFTTWNVHYALRPHSPSMLMENIRIHGAAYGIYRPAFENHVYRNLHISKVGAEPFNRGMDDASTQVGTITVDGLTFDTGYGSRSTPLIQISDNNLSGTAATHLRNVTVNRPPAHSDRWPLVNRGVGPRVPPVTETGVPIYVHDHFGPGLHAKIVSAHDRDFGKDGHDYKPSAPLVGADCRVAEVTDVEWPTLLEPVDDLPPATVILSTRRQDGRLVVTGVSHDNGNIQEVQVNGERAKQQSTAAGVVDWQVTLPVPENGRILASATDAAGNVEQTGHAVSVALKNAKR